MRRFGGHRRCRAHFLPNPTFESVLLTGYLKPQCAAELIASNHITVWLPICRNKGVLGSANLKFFRILLVEDSPSDVRLVREALKETSLPVQLAVARDGVEALNYLRDAEMGVAASPDLILLDLNLPRKNGREVLTEVKSSSKWRQIPVLVMTSSRSDDDIQQAYSLNANSYITKPDDLNGYIDVVRTIKEFWFLTATLPDPFRRQRMMMAESSASATRRALRN